MELTDEQLEQLRLALLKIVPKVILTKDDGEILMHLPDCRHAVLLTRLKFDPLQPLTNVKKCSCMQELEEKELRFFGEVPL